MHRSRLAQWVIDCRQANPDPVELDQAARFWADRAASLCLTAIAFGLAASLAGLLLSYHAALPSGPAIILSAGSLYLGSLLLGPRGLRLSLYASPRRRAI